MLPSEHLRSVPAEHIHALLDTECPDDLLLWLREVSSIIYDLSLQSETENAADAEAEAKVAERIQDTAEDMLRRCYLAVHHRLPPPPASSSESAAPASS